MLYQNDPRFNSQIRKYGCYLLSLHYHAFILKTIEFDFESVNKNYEYFYNKGFIESNCFVLNPDAIFAYFGLETSVRKAEASYVTKPGELEISRVEVSGINMGHFVVSRNGDVIYDSMFHTLEGRVMKVVSKRIFSLKQKGEENGIC